MAKKVSEIKIVAIPKPGKWTTGKEMVQWVKTRKQNNLIK